MCLFAKAYTWRRRPLGGVSKLDDGSDKTKEIRSVVVFGELAPSSY